MNRAEFLSALSVFSLKVPSWAEPHPRSHPEVPATREFRDMVNRLGPVAMKVTWAPEIDDIEDLVARWGHGRLGSYRLEFRGWMPSQFNSSLVGGWIGWPAMNKMGLYRYFYSSYPGGEGEYGPGDHFDIGPRSGQAVTTRHSTRAEFEAGFVDSFQRLMLVMQQAGIPELQGVSL